MLIKAGVEYQTYLTFIRKLQIPTHEILIFSPSHFVDHLAVLKVYQSLKSQGTPNFIGIGFGYVPTQIV